MPLCLLFTWPCLLGQADAVVHAVLSVAHIPHSQCISLGSSRCRCCTEEITGRKLHRYSGTAGRTSKPFNPLLGETYELICAEKAFRMLAEKVRLAPRCPRFCWCMWVAAGAAGRQLLGAHALMLWRASGPCRHIDGCTAVSMIESINTKLAVSSSHQQHVIA